MSLMASARLQVDEKRRTTLPGDVLAAAGILAGSTLVARVEEPGRIILESPQLLLAQLQADIAAGRARIAEAAGDSGRAYASMADELLAERAADTSLMDAARPNVAAPIAPGDAPGSE